MKITIDATVHVSGLDNSEKNYKKAKELFDRILKNEYSAVWSNWAFLEIQRALIKKGFSDPDEARSEIEELAKLSDTDLIDVNEMVRVFALRFIKELTLYASDAVHLATAIISNSNILLSEDEHLNKKVVKDFASKFELKIMKLNEFL